MNEVRRSLVFSFVERYTTITINLVMMVVVARLMTPGEVGVFMVGYAVAMLIESFREFGVSHYLIQEQEITAEGVRTAFTLSLVLSVLFATGLFVLTGPIAAFYGEQDLNQVLRIFALGFLLVPFSTPIMALLRRDMAFDRVAVIHIAGTVANCATVIVLAALGFGAVSFAWASLFHGTVIALTAILFRPQLWVFRPAFAGWRKVLSFGGYSSCTVLLNAFYQSLPQLILGRVLDFDAVGLYTRATWICQIPERLILSALYPVILPALSARVRSGGDLKEIYLRAISHVTALQWPFLLCLMLLANPVVQVLLGEQWSSVAPLVRIMALTSLLQFPAFITYPLLVSIGRIRDTLMISLIAIPVSVALIFIASFFGLQAVAASQFLAASLQVYVALGFIRRQMPFTWRELLSATSKSGIIAMCTAAPPVSAVALAGFRFDLSVPEMVVAGIAAAFGWAAGIVGTGHPLLAELRSATHAFRRVNFANLLPCRWTGREGTGGTPERQPSPSRSAEDQRYR